MEETKQYRAVDPVARFRWAIAFPGVTCSARLTLAALADHADQNNLTCWPSVATLARETQAHPRTVRAGLRQLEAAGAITTEQSRGRTSSVYCLLIPLNPGVSPPLTRANHHPPTLAYHHPNPGVSPPFNPGVSPPQQSHLSEQSKERNKNEPKQQQHLHVRAEPAASIEPDAQRLAAANQVESDNGTDPGKRHVCPECQHTWPQQFGTTCFKCQCDLAKHRTQVARLAEAKETSNCFFAEETPAVKPPTPPVSETAWQLFSAMGNVLPEPWLYHQGLDQLIGNRNFQEVLDILVGLGGYQLPEPEAFFNDYSHHLQEHHRVEAELDTEIKALFPPPKLPSNGTRQAA